MGWGRFLLLGNLGQQLDIQDSQRELQSLRQRLARKRERLGSLDAEVTRLAAELDETKLYVAALSQVLLQRGMLSEEELAGLVRTIDPEGDAEPT